MFEQALRELETGRKTSHWMWFIFPQDRGLGRSEMARFYGLDGIDEARAYLAHPLLSSRLHAAAAAVHRHLEAGVSAAAMLGSLDAMKLRSSLGLFASADPDDELFRSVLDLLA